MLINKSKKGRNKIEQMNSVEYYKNDKDHYIKFPFLLI